MRINELSKMTGASIRSIRYYEKKKLITCIRLENGYRDFDETAVELIKQIQLYLGLGLTTTQIEAILTCKTQNVQPEMDNLCEELLETYESKLFELSEQINNLTTVKQRLEKEINVFKSRKENHRNVKVK
ncbi:MerR family transcriptional regulator [Bacillus solimangrovi]|uniref:MerR family transcriptional regulator n=1 Tax=Bacillus solimangrovi TaxID=1305675 RepID=A0A1E5LFZ1_9BACI|nr:MerR family transcriptional regulator [Bacillus solimangrovi]OEH93008.1 MerR family transcriptional regulator [Bacillus solimangrovi]